MLAYPRPTRASRSAGRRTSSPSKIAIAPLKSPSRERHHPEAVPGVTVPRVVEEPDLELGGRLFEAAGREIFVRPVTIREGGGRLRPRKGANRAKDDYATKR